MKQVIYNAPAVELLEVLVEAGFVTSGDGPQFEKPEMQEEQEW